MSPPLLTLAGTWPGSTSVLPVCLPAECVSSRDTWSSKVALPAACVGLQQQQEGWASSLFCSTCLPHCVTW